MAQTSPEITRGVSWLASQVQANGSLANEANSIALALQGRAETAQTLKLLAAAPAALIDAIGAETDTSTELLARKAIALALAGRDTAAPIGLLAARQNEDGGFGGQSGYESDALDTAFALIALRSANQAGPIARAATYLHDTQAADGSFSVPGRPELEATAYAAIGLRLWSVQSGPANTAAQRSINYLRAQLSAQLAGGSVFLSALAYEALHEYITLEPTATSVRTFLVSRQGADGSWDTGDPFSSALALRALLLTGTAPADPTLAILRAKVVDAQTGLALAGANVAAAGPFSFSGTTAADGGFEFRNVAAGNYSVQLTLANYTSLSVSTFAQPGQLNDLGVLRMAKGAASTTGTVRGVVKDASTDQPLSGASVTITGGAGALTNAAGEYQIANVAPGSITVQATKAGYASVSAAALLGAGGVMVFSPALTPGTNQAAATLAGRATQGSDGAALPGVAISVTGANNAGTTSDPAGNYTIGNLAPGLIQIQASKAGYDSVTSSITIVGNSTLSFSPRMYASGTTPPNANISRVSGVVVDSGTRAPIAGAQVSSSNGPSVLTGADGRFTFLGSGTTQQLTFAAAGYQGGSLLLNWGLAGLSEIGEVGLLRADQAQLLPDLAVTRLSRQGLLVDPQTRVAAGTVSAVVANIGNALTQQPATLMVFEDRNRDGRFDAAADLALGTATLPAGLAVGEQAVPVALAGTLLFRDNALTAVIDRENVVPESNEGNNVRLSSCSPTALPFFDDFNDGNADGWVQLNGRGGAQLSVLNGELVRNGGGAQATGSFAWTDYSAQIKLRFPQGINNDAGLVFRARNANDWYTVRVKSGQQRLMKFFNGGDFVTLRETGIALLNDPDRPHTLRVDVSGRWMRAYLNGQFLFEYEGLEWEAGAVGTEQDGVLVHYDDLRVTSFTVLEDFNDGNADGWRPMNYFNTPATVVNGEYVRTSYGSSMYGSTSWKNYTAEVKLRFPAGMGNDGGLAILVRDPGSFVHVSINGGLIRLAVPGFGVPRSANVAVNTDPNFWHTLKAEVRGRTVKWYLNGQFLFDFDQLPWDNGAVGTIQDGVLVHYDDLRVTFGESTTDQPDLTASLLRLTQQGNFHTLTVRVGNGGGTVSPNGVRVAFYNGVPGAGGTFLGFAPARALAPGEFEDIVIPYAGPLAALTEVVAVVDENGTVAECDESNNRISLPIAAVPGVFNIRVETDQPSYGAHADVRATAVVGNFFGLPRAAQVRFRIESGDGAAPVTTLPLPPPVTVGAGGIASVPATWNTGTTLTGSYRVRAELIDAAGAVTAVALAPFSIVSGVTPTATSLAITDKPSYTTSDTVNLTARIANSTANTPLDDLRVATTVLNPDGSVRFTQTETLPQLPQGALRDYVYNVALALAPAGSYSVVVTIRTAAGDTIATGSSSFSVLSSSATGSGLAGTLAAAPKPVPFGDAVTLSASVSNRGNSAQSSLPLVLRVVDPATQAVLAEFQRTVSIAQGATLSFNESWPSAGNVGATVVAVLSATIGGAVLTLAQDTVQIAPPPVRLSGTLSVVPKLAPQGDGVAIVQAVQNIGIGSVSGVPIILSIVNAATGATAAQWSETPTLAPGALFQAARSFTADAPVGTLFNVSLSATIGGAATLLAQDSFSVIAPPVRLGVSLATVREGRVLVLVSCKPGEDREDDACSAGRAAFLDAYLGGLGTTRLVTTDAEVFKRALRGGQYNVYWVTGGAQKLPGTLAEEVREAVFRGDSLILDGVHDERNRDLDPVAGVLYRGKLNPADQAASVNGPLFAPVTLGTLGRPLNLLPTSGQAQAAFASATPAIVSNVYGLGRGIIFAYDAAGTLMTNPAGAQDALIQCALAWALPPSVSPSGALGYSVLRTRITNEGQAVALRVTLTAPAEASVISTIPGATADADANPVWSFDLAVGATQDLVAGVRLPQATGSYTLSAKVESIRNGIATTYGTFDISLDVEAADAIALRLGELAALAVSSNDRADRDHAVIRIQSALANMSAGSHEAAIGDLVVAAQRLIKITSANVGPYRADAARLLREAQARWAAQP